ncbi:MAG: hypothetical protein LBT79_02680 [Elusimicrobiota bacterium]|jgi:DNA-binding phage protein|nr:hypothetical protein [Elusimicrobiota bacterium]
MTKKVITATKDWDLSKEGFDAHFARLLSKDPQRIEKFKIRIIKEYNETQNLAAYLDSLKVIAMAQKKTDQIARLMKMKRPNVYRILSQNSNPSFASLAAILFE